jgi:denticleless
MLYTARFSRTECRAPLLAVCDEEGFVSILNASAPSRASSLDSVNSNTARARRTRASWNAHENALYDCVWLHDDAHLVTCSGDQTLKLWDVEYGAHLATFKGHSRSVVTVSAFHPSTDTFVSGGRDGAVCIWDARVGGGGTVGPVQKLHMPNDAAGGAQGKGRGRRKLMPDNNISVTSVCCIEEGVFASAGNASRFLYAHTRMMHTPTRPNLQSSSKHITLPPRPPHSSNRCL